MSVKKRTLRRNIRNRIPEPQSQTGTSVLKVRELEQIYEIITGNEADRMWSVGRKRWEIAKAVDMDRECWDAMAVYSIEELKKIRNEL